jgi:chemotaxis response regulator CheB
MQKRILIVDDNALIRGLVRISLESRHDLEVCGEASVGMEGVEKGLALRPDLIILDFSMPRINGQWPTSGFDVSCYRTRHTNKFVHHV